MMSYKNKLTIIWAKFSKWANLLQTWMVKGKTNLVEKGRQKVKTDLRFRKREMNLFFRCVFRLALQCLQFSMHTLIGVSNFKLSTIGGVFYDIGLLVQQIPAVVKAGLAVSASLAKRKVLPRPVARTARNLVTRLQPGLATNSNSFFLLCFVKIIESSTYLFRAWGQEMAYLEGFEGNPRWSQPSLERRSWNYRAYIGRREYRIKLVTIRDLAVRKREESRVTRPLLQSPHHQARKSPLPLPPRKTS